MSFGVKPFGTVPLGAAVVAAAAPAAFIAPKPFMINQAINRSRTY